MVCPIFRITACYRSSLKFVLQFWKVFYWSLAQIKRTVCHQARQATAWGHRSMWSGKLQECFFSYSKRDPTTLRGPHMTGHSGCQLRAWFSLNKPNNNKLLRETKEQLSFWEWKGKKKTRKRRKKQDSGQWGRKKQLNIILNNYMLLVWH